MDDDPHLRQSNETGKSALEYLSITTDYISLPLCSASVLADVVLIMVILKYRRLRTRTNSYLLHFAFSHILYIVSMPFFYTILDLFYGGELIVNWFCLWSRVEYFSMALTITFISGFGVDVILEAKKSSWFHKYEHYHSHLIVFIYFFHSIIYAIAGAICFLVGFGFNFNFYFLTIYYLLLMISLLYFGIENKNKKLLTKKEWILNMAITISLCWLPLFVIYTLIVIFQDIRDVETILWSVVFLPAFLTYSTSVISVWKLWKTNRYFKIGFKKFFRRSIQHSDYEELFLSDNLESR